MPSEQIFDNVGEPGYPELRPMQDKYFLKLVTTDESIDKTTAAGMMGQSSSSLCSVKGKLYGIGSG